jgi:hypothetical protein
VVDDFHPAKKLDLVVANESESQAVYHLFEVRNVFEQRDLNFIDVFKVNIDNTG